MRDIWAFNFMETARPALSSAGEVIFEPDERRCKDALRFAWECISSVAAFCADRLVLITIYTLSVSCPGRGVVLCATSGLRTFRLMGETSLFPASSSRLLTAFVLRQHLHRKE